MISKEPVKPNFTVLDGFKYSERPPQVEAVVYAISPVCPEKGQFASEKLSAMALVVELTQARCYQLHKRGQAEIIKQGR